MTRLFPLTLTIALVACAGAPSPDSGTPDSGTPSADDPATRYADRGAHAAGYAVFSHGERTLKAWYPADADPDAAITYDVVLKFPGFPTDPVGIHGTAAADAPVIDGPHPLVVLSHGFGLNPEWYHGLAEHLASHGFVVLAPEHAEADWFGDVLAATVDRPADISAAIDFAEAPAQATWIDADRVAVLGHSYGGYTALAAAGARFDPPALAERCAEVSDPFLAAYFCDSFVGSEAVLAAQLGLDAPPEGLWPSLGDARVDAIVAIAGDAYLFGEEGLAAVEVPALFLGGTADTGTPWDWGAALAHGHVSSDVLGLVGLEGAEHMIAAASCDDMPFTAGMPEEYRAYMCEDPAWDKADAHAVIEHMSAAWLLHTLTGDEAAAESLDAGLYAEDEALTVQLDR